MNYINTKGVMVYLERSGSVELALVPTAITQAKPAVVSVADTTGVTPGALIKMGTVGFPELDGKSFVAGTVDTTTISLTGSDTTGSSGTLGASPTMSVINVDDFVKLCLSVMEIGEDSVNQVAVGTYCDPSAQVPGLATPGTINLGGYADPDDPGLAEVQIASEDQQPRWFEIVLPDTANNGYLIGEISLSGFSMQVPLEGAVGWTATGTQTSKIRWVHD